MTGKGPGKGAGKGEQLWVERIASIKAGLVTAIALAAVAGLGALINPALMKVPTIALDIGIAAFSGFLFGITYRHLVGDGQDDHLQSGAIGAFALVRGLAQGELFWVYGANLWVVGIAIIESFVMFGLAALLLDIALDRQWIQRFTGWGADESHNGSR
jgi:hydrogenase/urease accessory protein HupE